MNYILRLLDIKILWIGIFNSSLFEVFFGFMFTLFIVNINKKRNSILISD